MADLTERLAAARKKAEALKSAIAKAQNEKKDCTINDAANKKDLKNLGPGLKARRVLKGHFGKVYAMHWSGDNINLVSASQVGLIPRQFYHSVGLLFFMSKFVLSDAGSGRPNDHPPAAAECYPPCQRKSMVC